MQYSCRCRIVRDDFLYIFSIKIGHSDCKIHRAVVLLKNLRFLFILCLQPFGYEYRFILKTVFSAGVISGTQQNIGALAAGVPRVPCAGLPGSRKIDEVDGAPGNITFPALHQPEIPFAVHLLPFQKCGQLHHKWRCEGDILRLNGLLPV